MRIPKFDKIHLSVIFVFGAHRGRMVCISAFDIDSDRPRIECRYITSKHMFVWAVLPIPSSAPLIQRLADGAFRTAPIASAGIVPSQIESNKYSSGADSRPSERAVLRQGIRQTNQLIEVKAAEICGSFA